MGLNELVLIKDGGPYNDCGARDFPNLKSGIVISGATYYYNCFSWALGRTDKWLDSTNHFNGYSIDAFIEVFAELGYIQDALGKGKDQIAIYGRDEYYVLHIARRIKIDGEYIWTSKIGAEELITHETPEELEGPGYGVVLQILSRGQ